MSAPSAPQRIVSLLPAATEILFALGVGDRVVGVTYECLDPPEAAALPNVTDTIVPTGATPAEIDELIGAAMAESRELYTLHREVLAGLEPDLIVTQDLCRVCALPAGTAEDALAQLGSSAEVFSYDPMDLDGVLTGILQMGQAAHAPNPEAFVAELRDRLQATTQAAEPESGARPRTLLLEWPDPPYTPGHWIPDQIAAAGGHPLLAHPGGRSSATTWEAIAASDAEVLIVAPCGFDEPAALEQLQTVLARPELADLPAVRSGRCYAIDADSYIVRPGPRLVDGVGELAKLIAHSPA